MLKIKVELGGAHIIFLFSYFIFLFWELHVHLCSVELILYEQLLKGKEEDNRNERSANELVISIPLALVWLKGFRPVSPGALDKFDSFCSRRLQSRIRKGGCFKCFLMVLSSSTVKPDRWGEPQRTDFLSILGCSEVSWFVDWKARR